ncbi:MAG: O-antigen ligase family protein [Clostridium sp.]|nr:O-antigen ligase family protein [Clostridium sp.]
MKSSNKKNLNLLIQLCTIFMLASFFVFESYTWGRYILMGTAIAICSIDLITNKKMKICIGEWHKYVFAFGLVCLLTIITSVRPQDSFGKFKFIIEILVCFTPIYNYYSKEDRSQYLLNSIKWAGYFVAVYSLYFYGLDFVISMLKSAIRLENSFSNINVIGQISAVAIIIQVYEVLNLKKLRLSCLLMVPSLLMILATQSRKAFVLLILGLVLVLIVSSEDKKNTVKLLMRITVIIFAFVILFVFLSRFSIFSGINERMGYLIKSFQGREGGRSAYLRKQMISVGWQYFLKNPVLGVGIGAPHIIALNSIGEDAYLHNNFIELLCGGGIIGFAAFYSIYIYLINRFIKYRKVVHYGKNICIIMLLLFLVMEWGKVSCYSKETYFYFMLFFIEVKQLRERYYNDFKHI